MVAVGVAIGTLQLQLFHEHKQSRAAAAPSLLGLGVGGETVCQETTRATTKAASTFVFALLLR